MSYRDFGIGWRTSLDYVAAHRLEIWKWKCRNQAVFSFVFAGEVKPQLVVMCYGVIKIFFFISSGFPWWGTAGTE